jgi:allantoin racemase
MAVSSREGVPSIEGHFDEAIAAVGVLEHSGRPSAGRFGHVIACFGDPGLLAARELAQGPVIGIAEAAMHMATLVATRFSIVTTLPRTLIIARHLLHQYGFYDHCAAARHRSAGAGAGGRQRRGAGEGARALYPGIKRGCGAIVLGCGGMATLARS